MRITEQERVSDGFVRLPEHTQACLFDLDGTLIDTEILWVEATVRYFAGVGLELPEAHALRIVYGRAWPDVHATIVREFAPLRDVSIEAMDAGMRPIFRELRDARDVRIAGSIALLRRAAGRMPVAVVSGSKGVDVTHGLHIAGVAREVAFHVSADDVPHGKPDPAGYRMAAARLALPPDACCVFEDSAAGIGAARAAGMFCVALDRRAATRQDLTGADAVVSCLSRVRLPGERADEVEA